MEIVKEALEQYDFINPELTFIRHNENMTYKVSSGDKHYVMRIHKPVEGFSLAIYQKDVSLESFINSEMTMLKHLSDRGLKVQRPYPNKKDGHVSILKSGVPVTVLSWLEGETFEKEVLTPDMGYKIGTMMGKLHAVLEPYNDQEITRYRYDVSLVDDMIMTLRTAQKNEHFTEEQVELLIKTLRCVQETMKSLKDEDFGLMHNDLSKSNMILHDEIISPIDFSLSGYGYYPMEVAMFLSMVKDNDIKLSVIEGYEKRRDTKLEVHVLEAFYAFGVLLFITCQHDKFYKEDWFKSALDRWANTLFLPLQKKESFLFKV